MASSSGTDPADPDRLGRPGQAATDGGPPRRRAFALAQRLEIHHTPKHGSWLNIAEIELSALTRQCLDRRIGDLDTLNTELSAWQNATNTDQRQVDWQFTTHDARIKLRHLYPKN
uniref:Transposase n=2 Tax=unclassified Streptomyces TaxID=2593676 RepID=A0AAU1I9Z8_9ACTN